MGKFRPPGITAYQQVLKQKKASPAASGGKDETGDLPEGKNPAGKRTPPEGFVKTGPELPPALTGKPGTKPPRRSQKRPDPPDVSGERDSKYRRLAKFLILIGGDEAARILSRLDMEQVEAVSGEIASVRGIGGEEAEGILEEFQSLLSAPYRYGGASAGGVEAARRILYAVYGPEKGEALLNRVIPDTRENPFSFLEDFSGKDLALLLKDEIPVTAALILSRVSPRLSAEILTNMDENLKPEVIRCIARQREVAPEVLEQAAAGLREKVRHIGHTENGGIDGMGILTAILKSSEFAFGDQLLEELEEENPELGRDLKERLYTLDDVVKMEDRPLQKKLQTLSNREIALLLKGRSGDFTEKILSNVSAQRRALVREEGELMGGVSKRDVDTAAQNFLAWFRLSREAGHILLVDDEDVIV
ncbi:MAG: flagellar motor switch protein FliG [Treponema sp.]|jgi:flagellar motor switch protein FliG|nr:flagellar motor switch protein FliG [Treponema sp.]